MATGPGETGNVLAAIASFFLPGLGQLIQGRMKAAILFFVFAVLLYIAVIGFFIHIYSIYDAATYRRSGV